jgi:glycosyltransferase involved in cell wall biosynthesis
MAVYNGVDHLERSLRSVGNALPADSEVIVVDDGSNDGTAEVLARFDEPWLRVHTQTNHGLTVSLNVALALAKGSYVARLDCGDACHPDRLHKQLQHLESHPDIALIGCRVRRLDREARVLGYSLVVQKPLALKRGLLRINLFQHSSIMARRTSLQAIGGYRPFFRYSQDLDLFLRLSEVERLGNLEEPLSDWVLDPDSISFRRGPQQAAYASIARECALQRRRGEVDAVESGQAETPDFPRRSSKEALAVYHIECARSLLMGGRAQEARESLRLAVSMGVPSRQVSSLRLFSYLPSFVRELMRCLRVWWLLR